MFFMAMIILNPDKISNFCETRGHIMDFAVLEKHSRKCLIEEMEDRLLQK